MSSSESEDQSNSVKKREGSPEIGGPSKRQFTLAISKEPPPKSTYITPYASKKLSRPIYHVENINPSAIQKNKSNNSVTKKRVRFKEDLVEIREYQRNPEEWTSFSDRPPYYETSWYAPPELKLTPKTHKRDMNGVVIKKQLDTLEVQIQEKREKLVLGANYISQQHIPPSPAEPDEIPINNLDKNIPVIPLFNEMIEEADQAPKPVINQNMMTPENLSAAANIAAAINQVFKIPPQQASYIAPAPTPQVTNYYTPPAYATSQVKQPQISNQTVEEMIKNNPDIMKSLKQLSRSAGDILDASIASQQSPSHENNQRWVRNKLV